MDDLFAHMDEQEKREESKTPKEEEENRTVVEEPIITQETMVPLDDVTVAEAGKKALLDVRVIFVIGM